MTDKNQQMYHSFLGQEFILWLYRKTSDDSYFSLDDFSMESIELFLEEQITLESFMGDGYVETIKSKDLTEQEDVRSSIRQGRIPSLVKARIIRGKLEWSFQIKAVPLMIKAAKLPIIAEKDEQEIVHQRLILLEELDNIIKALFNLFLLEREGGNFVEDMREFLELGE